MRRAFLTSFLLNLGERSVAKGGTLAGASPATTGGGPCMKFTSDNAGDTTIGNRRTSAQRDLNSLNTHLELIRDGIKKVLPRSVFACPFHQNISRRRTACYTWI